jgi:hypothetical protein
MRFLNKNSNLNNCLRKKKEYFIQKIEITPKRLGIGIHNVNKSGLKIKFYMYVYCQNSLFFSTFFIPNFEKLL